MTKKYFQSDISKYIWESKYQYRGKEYIYDATIEDTWQRVASTLAKVDSNKRSFWQQQYLDVLEDFKFIPGGRILAGIGTRHRVTLFNCFVMGVINDSIESIFENLKEAALTMQQGGGVGYDFSTIRPQGHSARTTGSIASGPVSFMHIWDKMCETIVSTSSRRGAMMATLRCDHPDILEFICAKQSSKSLTHFNLSVLVTDDFIDAVNNDKDWDLVFPFEKIKSDEKTVLRVWSGQSSPSPCVIVSTIKARVLWNRIMRATYEYAEPGVLFIDRINRSNNLWYKENISATNPCGEIPLPSYGACDLGSINLTRFIKQPFSSNAKLDLQGIEKTTKIATRMLDSVIDASHFPLIKQKQQAYSCRRIGLGFTGLADALIMLGLNYGEQNARDKASVIMKTICHSAYYTSIDLAKEKGCFPYFNTRKYLEGSFIQSLPDQITSLIKKHGIRNSHLTAVAPAGTISLLANNISSGIEPLFDLSYLRQIIHTDGNKKEYTISDYAYQQWKNTQDSTSSLPDYFVTANKLSPDDHMKMQAAVQPYVDNAISKTINVPEEFAYDDFRSLYMNAYDYKLKGCTSYRKNRITGAVLNKLE